jgi:pimeloyl-ACP methyl ester carboxylesterase
MRYLVVKTVRAAAALGVLLLAVSPAGASGAGIEGDWSGTLSFSGVDLRIIFHITSGGDGSLSATMDSPDQGAAGIPVTSVSFDGDSLFMEVAVAQAGYYGRYDPDSLFFDGEWRQAGFTLPLRLVNRGEIEPPARPQEPERPFPYIEEEVEFENGDAGISLAGTLTLPGGDGPFPAVVLITGSGPQDRDESLLGHKPFLVLSDHLTRRGIAVLRYDDRGTGMSKGDHGAATTADFAGDARAALDYLRTRDGIDRSRAGLVGHSEGGIIAAIVAAGSDDVAFVVMLAGPGLKGSEVLLDQNLALLELQGASKETIAARREQLETEYSYLAGDLGAEATSERIVGASLPFLERYSAEEREQFGFSEEGVRRRAEVLTSTWFRYFMEFDPATALREVKCPVLAMVGDRDIQVDAGMNLPAIEKALREGGNDKFRIVEMPGLNHLFQNCETGNPMEYSRIEETVSPEALELVGGWILSIQTGGR